MPSFVPSKSAPWGLRWRSSYWFVTFVVGLGLMTDFLTYSLIIPIIPFQLERQGHTKVSGLVGWLLFAFSAGVVLSTPPIASLCERYKNRQVPLVIGLATLVCSQVLLMEAKKFAVMAIARVIQGVSSSLVWVVGLALICDCTPEKVIGRQLGLAMVGLSVGIFLGPPAAGALYDRWGFRAPLILGMIFALVDLFARLLIIERKDAILWGVDPAADPSTQSSSEIEDRAGQTTSDSSILPMDGTPIKDEVPVSQSPVNLSPVGVLISLFGSSRAMICIFNTLVYGIVITGQEAILPLHLQSAWGLNPSKTGLAYMAMIIPTFVAMPLGGWLADKWGPEWVSSPAFYLSLPWWVAISFHGPLARFLGFLVIGSFFTTANTAPLTTELALVCRSLDGVGYAHVYGAFNIAYGVGTAIGPVISGQMYAHVQNGWLVFCMFALGLLACSATLAFILTGEKPLFIRLLQTLAPRRNLDLRRQQ